jgi:hypothetical protein
VFSPTGTVDGREITDLLLSYKDLERYSFATDTAMKHEYFDAIDRKMLKKTSASGRVTLLIGNSGSLMLAACWLQ